MSDRTQGSVRTGSLVGNAAEAKDAGPNEPAPLTATQAIPTTGSQRAQGEGAGAVPVVPQPLPDATSSSADGPSTSPGTAGASGSSAAPAAGATAPETPAATGGTGGHGRTAAKGRGPRRARLQLRHIDTWSALKISLVLSIALFFIWMVAVGVLYGVLSGLGVFTTVNDLFGQLGSASGSKSGGDVVTAGVVFGGAAVIGAINIVLLTALCTVGAFIYNLCSDLVGGLEVTLSERD